MREFDAWRRMTRASDLRAQPGVGIAGVPVPIALTVAPEPPPPPPPPPPTYRTVLLVRMTGADGSTTFSDESNTLASVTAVAQASVTTAHSRFGGSSAAFDGSDDQLAVDANPAISLGSEFHIRGWVRFSAVAGRTNFVFALVPAGSFNPNASIWIETGNASPGLLTAYVFGAEYSVPAGLFSPTAGQWHHIGLGVKGGELQLWVDGSKVVSTAPVLTRANPTGSSRVYLGGASGITNSWKHLAGNMQDWEVAVDGCDDLSAVPVGPVVAR